MSYARLNNIVGWIVFTIATFVYVSTIEPTASFWDCGEYIATAFKLQVGHPPGAPFFQILGRFFSLFAFGDLERIAAMVNTMSALSSSFTILFLFWTITALARKIASTNGQDLTTAASWAVTGSGFVGALAYTFTDSFWFSAVEGEVYAMSSFFTAIVFWAILKWDRVAGGLHADRWIVLIFYLVGLSIGVHLLNLLAIPAMTFVYYFRKYKATNKGLLLTLLVSVLLLGGVQNVIIPGVVNLAASFDLFFVNSLRLPFNSGVIFFFAGIIGVVVAGIRYVHDQRDSAFNIFAGIVISLCALSLFFSSSAGDFFVNLILRGIIIGLLFYLKKRHATLQTVLLSFTGLIVGYSSFFLIVIRSNANPPIDENNPETMVGLLSYLNREQYGDWPILYGPYYDAEIVDYKDGNPVYVQDKVNGKYVISDERKRTIPVYDPKRSTIFPRMHSQQGSHKRAYQSWANVREGAKPGFGDNLEVFFKYQVGHMYLRYFLWNFAGRQNDIQGHGGFLHGNWISGIPFIDEWFVGNQKELPVLARSDKARNTFYFLPLILGLIGLIYHFNAGAKDALVVTLLFLCTGAAIIIYLNQTPYQPRERDYAYAASFYAFAVWIGLGVMGIWDRLRTAFDGRLAALLVTAVCTLAVPVIMAKEGWDDHDRSGTYTARDFARNYLESCAKNAILFTNGDNDTFPLWYVQEVEGIRTDVRVVNLSLLNTDWYIDQMKRKAYDSDPVPFSMTEDQYRQGTRDYAPIYNDNRVQGFVPAKRLMEFVKSERADAKLHTQGGGKPINFLPTNKVLIPVDREKVIRNGTVPPDQADKIVPAIEWTIDKKYLLKNHLMVLDLLAHNDWERPVYFAVTVGDDNYLGLQEYFQLEGLAYRVVPVKDEGQSPQTGRVQTDKMYDNMMNKFRWGGMESGEDIYLNDQNRRMTMNFRNNFARLAHALLAEGKKEEAQKVLDRAMEVIPDRLSPYNYFVTPVADGYYRMDQPEKANAILERLMEITEDELNYYASLKPQMQQEISSEISTGIGIMRNTLYQAGTYRQNELTQRVQAVIQKYEALFYGRQQQPQPQPPPPAPDE